MRCGASRESLAVWAVRANVILAGKTEANETSDDPDVITKIPCNTDDDDRDQLPDAQESNGALGFGVPGEDDLTPLILALAPDDLPFGEVRLVLPTQSDFAVCAAEDKSDGRLTTTTWDLAAGASPRAVYLEATNISTAAQSLTWQYRFGDATLSEDIAVAKGVAALSADAPRARIRIVPTRTAYSDSLGAVAHAPSLAMSVNAPSATLTLGSNAPVGGMATGLLYVTLPPHNHMADDAVTIEAADPYDPAHLGVAFVVCSDWNAWYIVPDCNTVPDPTVHARYAYGIGPNGLCHLADKSAYPYWEQTVTVCTKFSWNTRTSANAPAGGEPYQVQLASAGGFGNLERTDTMIIMGSGVHLVKPTPTTADVQNVVITRLNETQTSNQDYIKYDPNPDSEYHTPTISFTVRDKGDYAGHTYQYQIFLQPTWASGRELLYKDQVIKWLVDDVDMASGSPVTKPVPWNGTIRQSSLLADRGTYTYDVQINEYDEAGNLIDLFAYKWPYCLSIGEHSINTRMNITNNGITQLLYGNYELKDYCYTNNGSYPNYHNPQDVHVSILDNHLEEIEPLEQDPNNNVPGYHYGIDGNGIKFVEMIKGEPYTPPTVYKKWRMLMTGVDGCWENNRRDHMQSRMLAENSLTLPAISMNHTRDLTDDELRHLLVALFVIRHAIYNGSYIAAVDINQRNVNSDLYYCDSMGYVSLMSRVPIKYYLRKSIIEKAAKEVYYHLQNHVKTLEDAWKALNHQSDCYFDVDENIGEDSAYTEFELIGDKWGISFNVDTLDTAGNTWATLVHELLHVEHGRLSNYLKTVSRSSRRYQSKIHASWINAR